MSLDQARVAICGLGLMGGSLALALRGRCREVLGVDPDLVTLARAVELGLADRLAPKPDALLPAADVVVLAAPLGAILRQLEQLPRLHAGGPVVLDLGSAKAAVVGAMEGLPARFDPIGGHPMCGKEHGGLEAAEAGLFCGAAFALTPLARTTPRARALAEELVMTVGAHALWIDAETHDAWTAATSHAPYLVANALAAATPLEAAPLVGPGWRSTARLAATPRGMMLDVLAANRGPTLEALARIRGRLEQLEALLAAGDRAALEAALDEGAARQAALLKEGGRP